MHDFQGYFPGLSRTLALISRTFQDQSDFPGLSRSWNFQEKKIQDFPGGVGTLKTKLIIPKVTLVAMVSSLAFMVLIFCSVIGLRIGIACFHLGPKLNCFVNIAGG